jgi:hypothetical protein
MTQIKNEINIAIFLFWWRSVSASVIREYNTKSAPQIIIGMNITEKFEQQFK